MAHSNKKVIITYLSIIAIYSFFNCLHIYNAELIIKPIPVILLGIVAWTSSKYNKLLTMGLIFSSLGDIFLSKKLGLFVPGLLSFLISHLIYILAFTIKDRSVKFKNGIISYVFGGIVLMFLWKHLDSMLIPVAVYIFVIFSMLWRSSRIKTAFWGAIFFIISDIATATNKFVINIPFADLIILSNYWMAQYLIFKSRHKKYEYEH